MLTDKILWLDTGYAIHDWSDVTTGIPDTTEWTAAFVVTATVTQAPFRSVSRVVFLETDAFFDLQNISSTTAFSETDQDVRSPTLG